MKILNAKREELAEVEGKLANLKLTFAEMTEKKQQLEFQVCFFFTLFCHRLRATCRGLNLRCIGLKINWVFKSVQKPVHVCIGFLV